VHASGTTNFNAAFAKAWQVFRASDASGASSGCNKVLLFLTDGKPNEPWGDEQYADVKKQARELDVHVMTYALGDGADAAVTKQLACDARGISHVISDSTGNQLENAMASYYKLLSPMLSPCQTRWVTYTDILTGTELLAACIATFETLEGSELTSCEGGLDGLGEEGDARVPTLLGVGCIDMNLVVALDTVRARDDWPAFDARVKSERAACPRVTVTEPQLETLRRSVSEAAVCGAVSPPSSPGGDGGKGSSDEGANAGAVAGGVIGGLVAFSLLVAGLVYLCRQKKAGNRSNANAQTAARAASATTGQGQQMSNVQPVVVPGAVVVGQAQPSRVWLGQAQPSQGSLYPPTYAMGTPVV